ncbi:MAG: D-glycero-alpha-D-manno-heptose-1,7-bisphosphate 7-phosphatase [Anaerolineales bacterium]
MRKRRAIFLDRDGVINGMVYNAEFGTVDSPANPDEFTLLPGVGNAIAEFNQRDYLVVVVSNQPGIAKGRFSPELLEGMTSRMMAGIESSGGKVDATYYCLHHPEAVQAEYRVVCNCRKPKPGLLLKAARDLSIDLSQSFMAGDGVTDVVAGLAAGTRTIFVNGRKCYACDALLEHEAEPEFIAANLSEVAEIIRGIEANHPSVWEFRWTCAGLSERGLPQRTG